MAIGLPYKKVGASSASIGLITDIHTSAQNNLGTTTEDDQGNEWIYLGGVANCVEGDLVTYRAPTFVAVRAVTGGVGGIAVAAAPILAGNFGWFMSSGYYPTANCTTVGAAGGLFMSGTAGSVQSAASATNMINGAFSVAAGAANKVGIQMFTPYVTATAPALADEASADATAADGKKAKDANAKDAKDHPAAHAAHAAKE